MTTVIFQEIKLKKILNGVCRECGKKRTRTINECQTVNPFNKNPDGTIKSRFEVSQSVREKLEQRVKRFLEEGFVCRWCKEFLGF